MTTEKYTILVIEDDPSITQLVKMYLEQSGYRVLVATDGAEGIAMHTREHPDLLVLDIQLPKVDGREVLREIRQWSATPVMLLTARNTENDRVDGLESGADDYISKPFSPREFVSRVKAILRRVAPRPEKTDETLSYGPLVIQPATHRVEIEGQHVDLTAKEFQLLQTLASAPDQVFTRDTLLNRVWGFEYLGDSRTVDVHIGTLRRKLEREGLATQFIKTIWRVGYKFDPHGGSGDDEANHENHD